MNEGKQIKPRLKQLDATDAKRVRGGLRSEEGNEVSGPIFKRNPKRVTHPGWSLTY